jgi:hypothetical protein
VGRCYLGQAFDASLVAIFECLGHVHLHPGKGRESPAHFFSVLDHFAPVNVEVLS